MRAIEKAGPLTAEDLVVLADSLRLAGRPDEALAALDSASALQPQLVPAWLARADVLIKAGRPGEAANSYQKVLDITPEHSEALRGLGDLALVRADAQAAGSVLLTRPRRGTRRRRRVGQAGCRPDAKRAAR